MADLKITAIMGYEVNDIMIDMESKTFETINEAWNWADEMRLQHPEWDCARYEHIEGEEKCLQLMVEAMNKIVY